VRENIIHRRIVVGLFVRKTNDTHTYTERERERERERAGIV
jgi:hypothetical protein